MVHTKTTRNGSKGSEQLAGPGASRTTTEKWHLVLRRFNYFLHYAKILQPIHMLLLFVYCPQINHYEMLPALTSAIQNSLNSRVAVLIFKFE
jgi:hypothetical protein